MIPTRVSPTEALITISFDISQFPRRGRVSAREAGCAPPFGVGEPELGLFAYLDGSRRGATHWRG
jgi:hypothetical protein